MYICSRAEAGAMPKAARKGRAKQVAEGEWVTALRHKKNSAFR